MGTTDTERAASFGILATVIMVIVCSFLGCGGGPVEGDDEDPIVGGKWAIAFGDASICFGTMDLAQSGSDLHGVWTCGVMTGTATGTVAGRDVTMRLVGGNDGLSSEMPMTGTVAKDGLTIGGFVDYQFAAHSQFAARRPWAL